MPSTVGGEAALSSRRDREAEADMETESASAAPVSLRRADKESINESTGSAGRLESAMLCIVFPSPDRRH
jgi:hypothetical protein